MGLMLRINIPKRGQRVTNGDVIKVLFSDYCIEKGKYTVWVGHDIMTFSKEWWNKPYKGGDIDVKSNS